MVLSFFKKQFGRHKSFLWGHWYPCFGLLVMSPLGFKARVGSLIPNWWRFICYMLPKIHFWWDTCQPLDTKHGSRAVPFHIPANRHWCSYLISCGRAELIQFRDVKQHIYKSLFIIAQTIFKSTFQNLIVTWNWKQIGTWNLVHRTSLGLAPPFEVLDQLLVQMQVQRRQE